MPRVSSSVPASRPDSLHMDRKAAWRQRLVDGRSRILLPLLFAILGITGCDSGVAPSPTPGVLRVLLRADAADTTKEIVGQHISLDEVQQKRFMVTLTQGQAYRDTAFSLLYRTLRSFQIEDESYNVLARENQEPPTYVVYETRLPPASYDSLQLVVTASQMAIGAFDNIPIAQPPQPLATFRQPFAITEGDTTEVLLVIRPLQSLSRFLDEFVFEQCVKVVRVGNRSIEPDWRPVCQL